MLSTCGLHGIGTDGRRELVIGTNAVGGLPNLSTWSLLAPQIFIKPSTALSLSFPGLGLRTVYNYQLLVKSITLKELLTPNVYHNNLSIIIKTTLGMELNEQG